MVRVERIELSSQPWEGCIIATIRYPPIENYGLARFRWPPRAKPTKCLASERKDCGDLSGIFWKLLAPKRFCEVVAHPDVEPPWRFELQTSALRKRRSSQLS